MRRLARVFLALGILATPALAQTINVTIDPAAAGRTIDPRIYGVNFGDPDLLDFPLRRWGGNSTTRYNWTNDVHNTAADYFFQNIAAPDPGTLPDGSSADVFVDETLATGGVPVLTVPLIGWTPLSVDRQKRWGFSVTDYGPQDGDECSFYAPPPPFWCTADSGNGRCDAVANPSPTYCIDGLIVGNDPADTSEEVEPSFVTGWMAHVGARIGGADRVLWALDNEPMLWYDTHRDVAPTPLDYDGLWSRTVEIAAAMKAAQPTARIMGPVFWGWCAYFTSAADAVASTTTCLDGPDRQAHGGVPLLAWYLDQVCDYEIANDVRLVDVLDVHYYPQGDDVSGLGFGDPESPAVAAARLRSLRELWDPSWTAESWIDDEVMLIPFLRQVVADHCPGLEVALTEYRWGTDDGASSALAQAEALAIFGREGLDAASRWVAPEPGTRVADAFRLFLDYDGTGSRVVGEAIPATSAASPDVLGAYAVVRGSDLLVLLFNHETTSRTAALTVAGGVHGPGRHFRLDPGLAAAPWLTDQGTLATTATGFSLALPARTASLVVVPIALFADGFESGDLSAW